MAVKPVLDASAAPPKAVPLTTIPATVVAGVFPIILRFLNVAFNAPFVASALATQSTTPAALVLVIVKSRVVVPLLLPSIVT